jgi:hypothetical protein
MAEAEIIGRVLSYPTIYGDAVWEGSDAPVQLRIAARRTSAGGAPDLYLRTEIDQIFYSVARKTNEAYQYVEDYEEIALDEDDVMPVDGDIPEDWDFDSYGWNFHHTVPHGALDGPAAHLVLYKFVLTDGTTIVQPVEIYVNAPCGMSAEDGGSSGGSGGSSTPSATTLIFSQTQTVTVHTEGAATTLIGSGEGNNLIAADAPAVGDKYEFSASGFYSTMLHPCGDAAMVFNVGAELTLTFPTIALLGSRVNARWWMRGALTYRTIGASATVVAEASLFVQDASPSMLAVGTTSAVTLPSDTSKAPNLKIDWETANVGNTWSCQQYDLRVAGGL